MSASEASSGARKSASSVFDIYNRSIRGNVLRGSSTLMGLWSDTERMQRYHAIGTYIITILLVFLSIALFFKWSTSLIVFLLVLAILTSICNSLLMMAAWYSHPMRRD